jgi:flavin reductase (DIM6/NTAB) family NADH-FMN oxidoreductase RutF
MIAPVDLNQAYRLLNHGPTTLISSAYTGRRNIMAAAWVMPLDFDPARVTLVIARDAYSRELIEASGVLAINVPCRAQAELVMKVGSCSGRDLADMPTGDKFKAFGLATFAASHIEVPLLHGCVAWLECRLMPEPHIQSRYDLFVAEVVAAHADSRVFREGQWHFDGQDDLRTLHHVAGGRFLTIGDALDASAHRLK